MADGKPLTEEEKAAWRYHFAVNRIPIPPKLADALDVPYAKRVGPPLDATIFELPAGNENDA